MVKRDSSLDINKYNIEYIDTGKEGFRITNKLLERIIKESKRIKKDTKLVIVIKRNDKENFILNIDLELKKNSKGNNTND